MEITSLVDTISLELWANIFSNIDRPNCLPLVCKKWNEASYCLRWDMKARVSPVFSKKVDNQEITTDVLCRSDITDVFRGAYYNFYLRKKVEECLNCRPLPLNGKYRLYPHQCEAFAFMRSRENTPFSQTHGIRGGILLMTMGLGKSLTALAYSIIAPRPPHPSEKHGENGYPTLIVASKTVMGEWKTQAFEKFFGGKLKVLYLHKDFTPLKEIDELTREQIVQYDFVVTTYDVCGCICYKREFQERCLERGDDSSLHRGKVIAIHTSSRRQADKPFYKGYAVLYGTPWERVIVDESQRFANPKTQTYRYMMALYGKYKWCLTGTPIRNKGTDIWSQLRFCGYRTIDSAIEWSKGGITYMKRHRLNNAILNIDYDIANIKLPPKTIIKKVVNLGGDEDRIYKAILGQVRVAYEKMLDGLLSYACVLALFTRLRQCCIAPYLMTPESKRKKPQKRVEKLQIPPGSLSEWIIEKYGTAGILSAKIQTIIEILSSIPRDEKTLVFSSFTSCLDLLVSAVRECLPDFDLVQIDGDVTGIDRQESLLEFRQEKEIRAAFMTYKVGSEGLNLTEATHVICIEPWWTPAIHHQAESRSWRFGQTKEVCVYHVFVENTIEKRIWEICEEKEKLKEMYLEGTEAIIRTGLDKATLGRILERK